MQGTVLIWLQGALSYKMHPKLGNSIVSSLQTENIAKTLNFGYKMHHKLKKNIYFTSLLLTQ